MQWALSLSTESAEYPNRKQQSQQWAIIEQQFVGIKQNKAHALNKISEVLEEAAIWMLRVLTWEMLLIL